MAENGTFHWPSGAQFVLSLLGLLGLGLLSLGIFSLLVFTGFSSVAAQAPAQTESLYLVSAGLAFGSLLLIPSVVYSLGRLLEKDLSWPIRWESLRWSFLLYPLALGLGHLVITRDFGGTWLLSLLHIIGNGSVIVTLIYLTFRGLPKGSPQRFWGVFNSGLFLAPLFAMIAEILALLAIGIVWGAYLTQHPDLLDQIVSLANRLPQSAANPAILERMINKYLFRPGVLWTTFLYVGVLIPLLEEIIKPIGVWLLAGRDLSPEEGLLLGMLSGAGYGLFENLTLGTTPDAWVAISVSRVGTTAVHMFTSGLVGWGLASAWRERNYLRAGASYFAAVLIHAAWNNLTLFNSFTEFSGAREAYGSFGYPLAQMVPVALFILAAGTFFGMLRANQHAQKALLSPENSD
jgi:hypothetical protein